MSTNYPLLDSAPCEKPSSKWGTVRSAVHFSAAVKEKNRVNQADTLAVSSASSSAGAAFARSLVLFTGFLFRRPSKLFKPNRVDTWLGLRQLAMSTDQSFSPSFIRSLLSNKSGLITITLTIIPPMLINATLGFLLFTSHSLLSLGLARMPFFQQKIETDEGEKVQEEEVSLETLIRGPTIIPNNPTILSALAGAGAGVIQGVAFTPVENVVRFVHQSATSWATILAKLVYLPAPDVPSAFAGNQPATPIQAIKNFFASSVWKKERSWWKGWKWAVARDAVSYSCFFAAFDVTRRVGLRVKGIFGGNILQEWENIVDMDLHPDKPTPRPQQSLSNTATYRPNADDPTAPALARVAQAVTIVTGGMLASLLAQAVGRPFRACMQIMTLDERERMKAEALRAQAQGKGKVTPRGYPTIAEALRGERRHPIFEVYKQKGLRPFIQSSEQLQSKRLENEISMKEGRMKWMMKRVGWRVASVGPWGLGFLVWAWVGGEV